MQIVVLTDETQTATVEVTEDFPVLYSADPDLRAVILKINDLHAVEPIDTVVFEADTDPYTHRLEVTLLDTRVVVYRFASVDADDESFVIEFTGGSWDEDSLELLDTLKDGVVALNQQFALDSLEWQSPEGV